MASKNALAFVGLLTAQLALGCGAADAGDAEGGAGAEGQEVTLVTSTLNYYVSATSGADVASRDGKSWAQSWKTLQYAHDRAAVNASTNAVVHLYAGTYAPVVVTKAGLTFENMNNADVTIAPSAGTTSLVKISGVWANANQATTFKRYGLPGSYTGSFTLAHATPPATSDANISGVNVYNSSNVKLQGLSIARAPGYGVVIGNTTGGKTSGSVVVEDCVVTGDGLNGIRENSGTLDTFRGNTITDNGKDGLPYNGDGILMQGTTTTVTDNTISFNGNDTTFEHGIYVGAGAKGYEIAYNRLEGNAASGMKLDGQGRAHDNRIFGKTKIGVVTSDNSGAGVEVDHNIVNGDYLYGIWTTQGKSASIANFHHNTFAGGATTWTPDPGGSPPTFVAMAYATKIDLSHNVFTAPGRTYSYRAFSGVAAGVVTSSTSNRFNLGRFLYPAESASEMTFATWKSRTHLDGNSTCAGAGC